MGCMSIDPSIPPPSPPSPPSSPDPYTPAQTAEPAAVVPGATVDKTVAVLSYATLIGFIVAIVINKGDKKNRLGNFHLRQMLGLILIAFAGMIVLTILTVILGNSALGKIVALTTLVFQLGLVVLWVLGLVAAINGRETPMPLVGDLIQKKLAGVFAS